MDQALSKVMGGLVSNSAMFTPRNSVPGGRKKINMNNEPIFYFREMAAGRGAEPSGRRLVPA